MQLLSFLAALLVAVGPVTSVESPAPTVGDAVAIDRIPAASRSGDLGPVVVSDAPFDFGHSYLVARSPAQLQAERIASDVAELRERGLTTSGDAATVLPLQGYRISSGFGWREAIPEAGAAAQLHNGLDLAAPQGSPIYSVTAGVVVHVGFSDWMTHTGWIVAVEASDGTVVSYNHIADGGVRVAEGQQLSVGDHLADVGSTGLSSGPHLHLSIRPDGENTVDPLAWLSERGLHV